MAEPLTFQALASSDYVLSSAENYILYVLLEAIAQGGGGGAGGTRMPLNLGVVIDRSGSMYDERRLEFEIDAVKFLANNVAPDDQVALVAFADRAKVILEPHQIHDKGAVQRALDDIDLLEIGGGTQMALGMQAAIDEVNKGHAPNRLNRVLVLTDGQTYQETACTELATKYREAMSFSTMGVGVEFNEKLLQKIAQDSNGKYHFIGNNPPDTEIMPVSRTVGADQVVDEVVFKFTHTSEVDWMLPGVAPTGRRVEIPLIAVVKFVDGKVAHEHIYWDQASVLVQVGLLDPAGLPVAGIETARKVVDNNRPSNELMARWPTSEGKPI